MKKMTSSWKSSHARAIQINSKVLMCCFIIYLVPNLWYNTEVYYLWYYVNIVKHSFGDNIINSCIIFIWLNWRCILPNLYWTVLYCGRFVGPTPWYSKWDLLWRFTLVWSVSIEHGFISYFIALVKSFSIFAALSLLICVCFFWRITSKKLYVLLGELYFR